MPNADEQSNIEVDSQRHQGLNLQAMLVCHRVDCIKDHSQGHFMAVFLADGGRTVLVEAHVWLTGTEDGHVSESDTKQPTVCNCRERRFQEWDGGPIRVEVNDVESFICLPYLIAEIDSIGCRY